MKTRKGDCQIKFCQSENVPIIYVNETIADACFKTIICTKCADAIGIEEEQELTEFSYDHIKSKVEARLT